MKLGLLLNDFTNTVSTLLLVSNPSHPSCVLNPQGWGKEGNSSVLASNIVKQEETY